MDTTASVDALASSSSCIIHPSMPAPPLTTEHNNNDNIPPTSSSSSSRKRTHDVDQQQQHDNKRSHHHHIPKPIEDTFEQDAKLTNSLVEFVCTTLTSGTSSAPVSRDDLEQAMIVRFGHEESAALCRATISVLFALGMVINSKTNNTLQWVAEQADVIRNVDHHTHALILLRQQSYALGQEMDMLEKELAKRVNVKLPLRMPDAPPPWSSSSPVEMRYNRDVAASRVRDMQRVCAKVGKEGMEEIFGTGRVTLNEGPLGVLHPGSTSILELPPSMMRLETAPRRNTRGQQHESDTYQHGDVVVEDDYELSCHTKPIDFSEIATQFEVWVGGSEATDFQRLGSPRPSPRPTPPVTTAATTTTTNGTALTHGTSPRKSISYRNGSPPDSTMSLLGETASWSRAMVSMPPPPAPLLIATASTPTPAPVPSPEILIPRWTYIPELEIANITDYSAAATSSSSSSNVISGEALSEIEACRDDVLLARHDAALVEFKLKYEQEMAQERRRRGDAGGVTPTSASAPVTKVVKSTTSRKKERRLMGGVFMRKSPSASAAAAAGRRRYVGGRATKRVMLSSPTMTPSSSVQASPESATVSATCDAISFVTFTATSPIIDSSPTSSVYHHETTMMTSSSSARVLSLSPSSPSSSPAPIVESPSSSSPTQVQNGPAFFN